MLIACCVVAVTLDDGGEQQPSQEPQMEPDLLVAGALVDPVKNGRQFLFRLLEKRLISSIQAHCSRNAAIASW